MDRIKAPGLPAAGLQQLAQQGASAAELPLPAVTLAGHVHEQIGNTPMIGRNDVESEVFYQADAHKVG